MHLLIASIGSMKLVTIPQERRRIVGFTLFQHRTGDNTIVWICHLVLDGSAQYFICQNITFFGDIRQIGKPLLVIQQWHYIMTPFSITKVDPLIHMPGSFLDSMIHHLIMISLTPLLLWYAPGAKSRCLLIMFTIAYMAISSMATSKRFSGVVTCSMKTSLNMYSS